MNQRYLVENIKQENAYISIVAIAVSELLVITVCWHPQ